MHLSNESLLVIVLVGLIAGWLAGKVMQGSGFGLIGDLVVGLLGALVGDWLLPRLNIHLGSGIVALIVNALIGAIILLFVLRPIGGRGWGQRPVLKDGGGEFGRYFGEPPGTPVSVTSQYLAPAIRGCMPGEIAEIHERMSRAIKGFPYAKAALELAAYDLAGKQCGLPVHRLLGGALRRKIPVTHSIGLIGFEEAEREAAQAVREGIRTIKIKIGVEPDRDVELVRRVREAVGPAIELCVDANQGYRTVGEAVRTFRRMERNNLIYF